MVCKNNNMFPRIAIFAFLLIILCSVFVGKYIAKKNRMDELSEKYCYEVYFKYIENRQSYSLYFMCNPDYTVENIIENVITDEFLFSLQQRIDNSGKPKAAAVVYMMSPTKEIPYGWKKSNLNISCNFDISVFHRNTVCIVKIPYGAESLGECAIDYKIINGTGINFTVLDKSMYEEE